MKRKRLPAAHIIRTAVVPLKDRTAVPPNPRIHHEVAMTEGPDGTRQEVYRVPRLDCVLERMESRGQIDFHQYLAGDRWRTDAERAEQADLRAIDPTKDVVDGGRLAEPLSDARAKALNDLRAAGRAMGMIAESVVRDVLMKGYTMEVVAEKRGWVNRRSVDYYGRVFRDALSTLAVLYGIASPRG